MSGDPDNLDSWLTEHPEAKDDLSDLARLRALYQSVWPPEPDEAAWTAVPAHIHQSILRGRSRPARWPRLAWSLIGLAAASVLLGLVLARSRSTTTVPVPVPLVEEPFPVAEADDVTIISIDARDVAALVVGEPPVWGDLEFARAEDIHVVRCERCPVSGRLARLEHEGEVPMFVSATVAAPEDD